MGRWLDWTLSADLTNDEIETIKEICNGILVPALISIADRKREPAGLFARLFHMVREEQSYVRSAVFTFSVDSITVAQHYPPIPLIVPFTAGDATGRTLGFPDLAVFGLLAAIANETGKLRLLPGCDVEHAGVIEALAMIEAASSYRFKDISVFASPLAVKESE